MKPYRKVPKEGTWTAQRVLSVVHITVCKAYIKVSDVVVVHRGVAKPKRRAN